VLGSTAPAGAAVTAEGNARAWGDNTFGQLGNRDSGTSANIPVAVRNISSVKSVKAGCSHGLALLGGVDQAGLVRAWGYNHEGELGDGTTDDSNVPVAANIENVKAIAAGCSHSLALKEDGSVWAWGDNFYGQLGNGKSGAGEHSDLPIKVADIGTGAKAIAAGENFSLALMKDGTVKAWGRNYDGELGSGSTVGQSSTPVTTSNLSNVKALAADSTSNHALALLNDGTVKAWGLNNDGQLGNGATLPGASRARPVKVANLTGVRAIAAGGEHSLALLTNGRVKSWGNNDEGELGNGNHGDSYDRSTPGNVIGLTDVRFVAAGADQSFAALESGRARSWGDNSSGELGNGNTGTDSDVPVGVKNLTTVRNLDGGYDFTLAAI
jgi:alpha-tubulin suppressor-like RCC1 family protein